MAGTSAWDISTRSDYYSTVVPHTPIEINQVKKIYNNKKLKIKIDIYIEKIEFSKQCPVLALSGPMHEGQHKQFQYVYM